MDIKVLKSSILSINIPNFLIFVSGEQALVKQYIEHISTTLGKRPTYFYSVDSAIRRIEDEGLDKNLIIINDPSITSFFEKYMNYFINSIGKEINVILELDSVDKRTDFYKKYKDFFVVFEKLDKYTILAYVLKLCQKYKCSVDQERLLSLIDRCDCDLGIILNEMDKIFVLGQENSNVVFDFMMRNGFSDYRKVNIYDFINKVLNGNRDALKDIYRVTDPPVGVLTLMYNNARKRLIDSGNNQYAKIMRICNYICQGIVDATVDPGYALKYALLEIFK